ncbi:MAG: hypothetical protein IKZ56_11630 [Bacteroidales bacterium]|nr:hypothetical protein [Bacteroidales bacterium]
MKKLVFSIIAGLLFVGCQSEEVVDITQHTWKVNKIATHNHTYTVKNKDYLRDDAYMLIFLNDSMFQLNTSINLAYGKYEILANNTIKMDYTVLTEVGGGYEIDTVLTNCLGKITSYKNINNKLVFEGRNCKMVLTKE